MKIFGHRGAMGEVAENTLLGFERAISAGVDFVELDVRKTLDDQLIVMHDPDLKRLYGVHKHIRSLRLAEIVEMPRLDGEHSVDLKSALRTIGNRTGINIELKETGCASLVREQLDETTATVIISSFLPKALEEAKKEMPEIPRALLRNKWPFVSAREQQKLGLSYLALKWVIANRLALSRAKSKRLEVYAYTVDSPTRLRRLHKLGIMGVVRNNPSAKIKL